MCVRQGNCLPKPEGIVRYSKRFVYPHLFEKINKLEVIENRCGSKNGSIKRKHRKIMWFSLTIHVQILYYKWVPVSSTGKVFYGYMKDLELNSCLYQKLIGLLV